MIGLIRIVCGDQFPARLPSLTTVSYYKYNSNQSVLGEPTKYFGDRENCSCLVEYVGKDFEGYRV
jgi:hypothetical protein